MTKRTRFKIAVVTLIYLACLTVYAVAKDLSDIASQGLAAIMVIAPVYIFGDSWRKSDQ